MGVRVPPGTGDGVRGDWVLAVDFGTSFTCAAMAHDGQVGLVRIDGELRMPSTVFWREGTATGGSGLVVGAEAENWGAADPACLERAPKRRMGDHTLRLGSASLDVVETVGAILTRVSDAAIEQRGGSLPGAVCLTYPVRWGDMQCEQLEAAAKWAGLGGAVLVEEPIAAAVHFGSADVEVGAFVAVYDLGGGTFDTVVLRRTPHGFEIVGEPGGDPDIGGEDFDDRLYRYVTRQLDPEHRLALTRSGEQAWRQANRQLQREVRRAKEALSGAAECPIYIPPPVDRPMMLTAGELEQLIAEPVAETVDELERTVLEAGLSPSDLAGVYLAGGSSRVPLVTRMIGERLGLLPKRLDDPKAVVVLGAARVIAESALHTGESGRRESSTVSRPQGANDRTELDLVDDPVALAGAAGANAPPSADPSEQVPADPPTAPEPSESIPAPPSDGRPPAPSGRRRLPLVVGGLVVVAAIAIAAAIGLGGGGGGSTTSSTTTRVSTSSTSRTGTSQSVASTTTTTPPPTRFTDGSVQAPATLAATLARVPIAGVPFGFGTFNLSNTRVFNDPGHNKILLFIGDEACPLCESLSWPLVIALSRFGTFSRLAEINSGTFENFDHYTPGFSFYGSSYSSQYLQFVEDEIKTNTGATLQTPSSANESLYTKYAPNGPPFLDFGGLITLSSTQATFNSQELDGKTFSQIAAAALNSPSSGLGEDIDGEANALTADLCEMTNGTPPSVCDNSEIADLAQSLPKPGAS